MNKGRLKWYALAVALIVAADQCVKAWASAQLQQMGSFTLIPGVFGFRYTENAGASFGILQGGRWFFVAATAVAVTVILYAFVKRMIPGALGRWSLICVLGGTLGNFIDRLVHGYVVDMFEFLFIGFAIFNVADIFVSVGGVLFCVYLLFFYDKYRAAVKNEKSDE